MSEDRHYFSEPRPIAELELPTWDVDVYREGVNEPLMTLRIDPATLPPRTGGKGKKKKVVWKLPDAIDQVPRFGADEKRRLLDLFKNLKKERRKKNGDKETILGLDNLDKEDNHIQESNPILEKPPPPPPPGISISCLSMEEPSRSDPLQQQQQQPQPPSPTVVVRQPEMILTRRNSAPLPPGIPTNGSAHQPQPQPGITNGHSSLGTTGKVTKPPPGLLPRAQSLPLDDDPTMIMPKQTNSNQSQIQIQLQTQLQAAPISAPPPFPVDIQLKPSEEIRRLPALSVSSQLQYPPPGQNGHAKQPLAPLQPVQQPLGELPRQSSLPPPGAEPPTIPPILPPSSLPPLPPPSARYLKFPATTMPPEIFAQQVANLYISLLQSGQVEELLLPYYTLTAQKSLSLKSAKSMCRTPQEIKTQLVSLVGCGFAVQGITVQEGFRNSLLIIWSGICQLQGQPHGFCQTLILVPLPTSSLTEETTLLLYQIQNDALVLLTND